MNISSLKEKLKNSIAGKSAIAFLLKVLSAGLAFGYNVVLANIVGAEGAGKYFLAFTILGISRILSLMGMRNVVLRYTAASHSEGNSANIYSLLKRTLLYVGLAGLSITGLVFLLSDFISIGIFNNRDLILPFKLMILAVTPSALILICSEAFKAFSKFKLSLLFEGISIPFIGIILMPILALNFGVIGAIISFSVASWLVFVASLITLKRVVTLESKTIKSKTLVTNNNTDISTLEMFKVGYSLLLVELLAYWIGNGDTIIIGYFIKNTEEVGIYAIAQRLATLVSFILIAVNTIVAPQFSKLFHTNQRLELEKLAQKSTKLLIIIASPILLFYIFFPDFLLGIFGGDFKKGGIILSILAVGQFVNVITGSVGYLLIMCGQEKTLRNIIIFSALVTITFQLILVSEYSIMGIAIGTAIGLSLQNILATIFVKKKLNIDILKLKNGR